MNNGTKTITLGGDLTTSSGFNTTLSTIGTTNVTLPTTGTLATLAGTEALYNKTLYSPTVEGPLTVNSYAYIANSLQISNVFHVSDNGLVNMGSTLSSTTSGRLTVGPPIYNKLLGNYSYFNFAGSLYTRSSEYVALSIYAEGDVAANTFKAFSDARSKKIVGFSKSRDDLKLLEAIKITNYKKIDSVAEGNKVIKKVIAQQVEKVYPQAVSKTVQFIPSIYKMTTVNKGFIPLKTDVVVGNKIKFILKGGTQEAKVIAVSPEGFTVDAPLTGAVFVFGKEVKDFRMVDYEAISMLNVSATQELSKKVKELEKTNKKQNQLLLQLQEDRVELTEKLQTRLARLEMLFSKNRK